MQSMISLLMPLEETTSIPWWNGTNISLEKKEDEDCSLFFFFSLLSFVLFSFYATTDWSTHK